MPIDKKIANAVLSHLDQAAGSLEALMKSGKVDPKIAASLIRDIDSYADRFEIAAFGKENLLSRQAKVLKKDSDEKYMDTFDNPVKPLQTDADEEYMHKVGPSFNSKAIDTFDTDRSSAVSERDEYNVRDLNDMADGTKKQPSWSRGPAGKSTRGG